MFHYDTEKNVNTLTADNGKSIKKQVKQILTYVQRIELKYINGYRAAVGVADVEYSSELQCLANYRAYINASENWAAHTWAETDNSRVWELISLIDPNCQSFAENTVTQKKNKPNYGPKAYYELYYSSEEHYEAMVDSKYNLTGVSNTYFAVNNQLNTFKESCAEVGSQFDCYMTAD